MTQLARRYFLTLLYLSGIGTATMLMCIFMVWRMSR